MEYLSLRRGVFEYPFAPVLRHFIGFPCSLVLFPFQMTVRKTGEAMMDKRVCPIDSGLHACGHLLRDVRTRHSSISAAYESAPFIDVKRTSFCTKFAAAARHSRHDIGRLSLDATQVDGRLDTRHSPAWTVPRINSTCGKQLRLLKERALLWSEMRRLRASIDQLLEADPHLGHEFAAVNRGLEALTKSIPPSHDLST
jgi:hypothetical protein